MKTIYIIYRELSKECTTGGYCLGYDGVFLSMKEAKDWCKNLTDGHYIICTFKLYKMTDIGMVKS